MQDLFWRANAREETLWGALDDGLADQHVVGHDRSRQFTVPPIPWSGPLCVTVGRSLTHTAARPNKA